MFVEYGGRFWLVTHVKFRVLGPRIQSLEELNVGGLSCLGHVSFVTKNFV